MKAWLAGRWQSLLQAAEARLPALTRLRKPEALPVLLDRRRIYVLPTGFGVGFGLLLSMMTLGALNYDNNPALILCFLLASAAHVGLLSAFLDLRGLRLREVHAAPVHAGDSLQLHCQFDASDTRSRHGLRLARDGRQTHFSLASDSGGEAVLSIPTRHRGHLAVGRISVSTRRPLGMFVAWSWLHPQRQLLVYPAPEINAPPLPQQANDGQPQRRRGPEEELHSLRDYRSGDPLRTVAWKRSAQLGHLLVREFETPHGRDALLDWSALAGLSQEARIRRLTRWLLEAERLGLNSELRLPNETLGPGKGKAHLHACLSRLALLPGADQ